MARLTLVNVSEGFSPGFIPLGLVSIATYLKRYGGHDVAILDANCQNIYSAFRPTEIVGIGAVTQDIGRAVRFARHIREEHPDTVLVLGGVHITTHPVLPDPFDIGVIGEGEETMRELLGSRDFSPDSLNRIHGICFRDSGRIVTTPPRELITPIDRIPIPDRDMVDLNYYLQKRVLVPYQFGRTLSIITSRGCPFSCTFCSTKIFWKRYRVFSAERVVEEIGQLIDKYGAEVIHIFDDLFIGDRKRLSEIHRLMLERGLAGRAKFMCLARSDILDDQTMKVLKDINVVVVGIGMESGCDSMLRYLKRGTTTTETNRKAIDLATKYRIPVMGSFMIGNPGETEEDLLKTLEFIRGYRYSPFLVPLSYISAAFPGTEFWNYAISKGIDVEQYDKILMDIPNDITKLKEAPLLTDLPLRRFYDIAREFLKETRYGEVKRHNFTSTGLRSTLTAYILGVMIEGSILRGLREVRRIRKEFSSTVENRRAS
jgi:magnesium-protoporphyrin IX monomethyl ester (oxidative) cyclase